MASKKEELRVVLIASVLTLIVFVNQFTQFIEAILGQKIVYLNWFILLAGIYLLVENKKVINWITRKLK